MIEVKLKCKCTDGEVAMWIRSRNAEEDIRDYMQEVTRQVGLWHAQRDCPETKLEYLKLPIVEGKGIGET